MALVPYAHLLLYFTICVATGQYLICFVLLLISPKKPPNAASLLVKESDFVSNSTWWFKL
jgi:hypothetical protein